VVLLVLVVTVVVVVVVVIVAIVWLAQLIIIVVAVGRRLDCIYCLIRHGSLKLSDIEGKIGVLGVTGTR
jgi:hypothetical protein